MEEDFNPDDYLSNGIQPTPAPWEDEYWHREPKDNWHHISDVMKPEVRSQKSEEDFDDWDFEGEKEIGQKFDKNYTEIKNVDDWNFGEDKKAEDIKLASETEIKIEDISDFDFGLDDMNKKPVPHKAEEGNSLKEESLNDEPVFYEEPV